MAQRFVTKTMETVVIAEPKPMSCEGCYYLRNRNTKSAKQWEASYRDPKANRRILIGYYRTELEALMARVKYEEQIKFKHNSPARWRLELYERRVR